VNDSFLTINNIRKNIENRNVDWTKHCLNRLNQRNIYISNIKLAIKNGEIIEYYMDDYPYPSCLIVGKDIKNEVLHIICSISNNTVHMITAYYPDSNKWEEDMKTRRKK